jgi:Type III flagellar switch regulator (C-ring) FliN C-term
MRVLTFGRNGCATRVRRPRFEERSLLPPVAACVVASATRERLTALFGAPIAVRLLEPQIPTPQAWKAILRGATLYRVRGSASDAAIVLRPADAAALASAAFGETLAQVVPARKLSPLERGALDRMVAAIAGTLGSVCGERDPHGFRAEPVEKLENAVTYFELSLELPAEARVGVALARDPAPEPSVRIREQEVGDLRLRATGTLEVGKIAASAVTTLAPGQILPIPRSSDCRGSLKIGGRVFARGFCGVTGDRYALEIEGMGL